ncbi:MAG: hypothetical protein U5K30_00905 [Acidimicrobiales bacterium]|nr:hypothetical protein [Acidimicrobiales bacterium]
MASNDGPELSSIHDSLEDLARRVVDIAERRDTDPEDQLSNGLFEVDRSLRNAIRQLDRVRNKL